MLEDAGHTVQLLDGHLLELDTAAMVAQTRAFAPDLTVVTTAPTYLFWRCAQPELRVPTALVQALAGHAGRIVAVGPHGSTTPRAALRKLGVDAVVMGECEDTVAAIAGGAWADLPGLAYREGKSIRVNGGPQAARFIDGPPLSWPDRWIGRHRHHHHRFDAQPQGPGAEVEASRGCPYHCTFCAKENFRDVYRRRALTPLLAEIDRLTTQGVEYIYFVDEIFLPRPDLLEALTARRIRFGIQTRIDLWKPSMLELLGRAGCVSIEAGVESVTAKGRAALAKNCRMETEELLDRLVLAKRHVPFVQANLLAMESDDDALLADWRQRLRDAGVWANDPVPLFPYPGAPEYRQRWGDPDDLAWERAVEHYRTVHAAFSDLQEEQPLPLDVLEQGAAA